MRVPQVDIIDTHPLQTLLARLVDVLGVAAEAEVAISEVDTAELGGEEDVGTLAGPREPLPYEVFRISLTCQETNEELVLRI